MKKLVYTLLFCGLLACGSSSSEQPSTESPIKDKTPAENLTKKSTDAQNPDSTTEDMKQILADFPKQWRMITNENEEFVFSVPCDAMNPEIHLIQQEGGNYLIQHQIGQEGINYDLVSIRKWEEPFADEIETYYEITYREGTNTLKAKINFSSPEKASWIGLGNIERPTLYAPESHFDKYPILKSPCTECFSALDCEKEQDWGIGILKPVFQDKIHVYNYKGAEEPAQTIYFSNGMVSNFDKIRTWSAFEAFNPDYDLFFIRCLKEEDGWYKILANKNNERIMWVKKSDQFNFLTWEEYLLNTLDVTVLEPNINIFRLGKGEGNPVPTACTGGFKILAIEGMYIKVKHNELTTACDSGTPPTTEGWLQWRNEKKMLIRLAWIM